MEDFGSGELKQGVAVVKIDPSFSETVTADASYHVFITPNADSKGLYVIAKTPTTSLPPVISPGGPAAPGVHAQPRTSPRTQGPVHIGSGRTQATLKK
jgi:hypothetical protein